VTIGLAGISYVAAMAASAMYFRDPQVAVWLPAAKVGAIGLVLSLGSLLLIGRLGKAYRFDFSANRDDIGLLKDALVALGNVPLRALKEFMLFIAAYLVAVAALFPLIGLRSMNRWAFLGYLFALGLLDSSFIFVLVDRLGTKVLLEHRLMQYPAELRERRQQRKNFIIPTFMTAMTFLFALSIALLVLEDTKYLSQGSKAMTAVFAAAAGICLAFFVIILILVTIWTSSTALIYRSVMAQLDQLSSAEKDLTKRISICSVDELGR